MILEDNDYLQFYHLQSPPFTWTGTPLDSGFYFLNDQLQKNVVVLYHFIDARDPMVLITAEDGYGKTAFITYLDVVLNREKEYKPLKLELSPTKNNPEWFLQQLGYVLNLTPPYDLDEVIDALMNYYLNDIKVVLLIDNDKLFHHHSALDNLRALFNIQPSGHHLFTAVLTATPEATKLLECNREFATLVSRRLTITPFSSMETGEYIDFHLERVGGNAGLFLPAAAAFIHEASHGIPLRINLLAQYALSYGAKYNHPSITEELVLKLMPSSLGKELSLSDDFKTLMTEKENITRSETLDDFLNTKTLKQLLLSAESEPELVKKLDHIIAKCIFLSFLSERQGMVEALSTARYILSTGHVKEALNILKNLSS